MRTPNRLLAGVSAVALAAGTILTGAGIASAQGSSEIATDLSTAAEALNGPATVTPNDEGGPTVTYANETDATQNCLGFTAPYQTVIDEDLDTNYDEEDLGAALALVNALEDGGNISLLLGEDGEPVASEDPNPDEGGDVANALIGLLGENTAAVVVEAGEEVSWTAPTPDTPALAVVACLPEGGGLTDLATYTGIDKQVVADQINGMIPGGSLDPISAGSVSGGSVEMGATALGSLAGAGGDDGGEEEPPVEPAE